MRPTTPEQIADRDAEVEELAARHNLGRAWVRDMVTRNLSIEAVRGEALEVLIARHDQPEALYPMPGYVGLTPREKQQYSLFRWIRTMVEAKDAKPGSVGTFEREISDEIAKRAAPRQARGLYVPMDIMTRGDPSHGFFTRSPISERTLTSTGGTASGGAVVQSTVLASQYVPPNYNVPVVVDAGATVLPGLRGNILIPAMTAGKSATWITPENTAVSEGDPTFAQIPLSPHDVGAVCDISRRLLIQSSPGAEQLVRDDIIASLTLGIDEGALTGTGSSGQSTGVMNQSGVAVVSSGANGGPLTWSNVVYLPQSIGAANRLIKGAPKAFITNWQVFAHGMRTPRLTGNAWPEFLFEYSENKGARQGKNTGMVGNIPIHTTQQLPSNLTKGSGTNLSALLFGNWADLLIGEWGLLDLSVQILRDPYTFSSSGAIRLVAFQTIDVGVRYPGSFAMIKDLVTT